LIEFHTIVIGGGIAGLTTGAYLAKEGKKVLVIEQNSSPGGYWTSFMRKGIIFDITAHWTVGPQDVNDALEELNIVPLEFSPHEPLSHYINTQDNSDIILTKDQDKFKSSIRKSYPSVKEDSLEKLIRLSLAIEKEIRSMKYQNQELMSIFSIFFSRIKLLIKLRKSIRFGTKPAKKFLQDLFPGNDLEGLRCSLYSIAPIKDISAIGMLALLGFALKERAFHPVGGAQRVATAFVEALKKNGGKIRYSQKVKEILIQNQKVAGVKLDDNTEIKSKYVVSTVDTHQTFYKLLDPQILPAKFKKRIDSTPLSDSFLIVSLVTDINLETYGFNKGEFFVGSSLNIDDNLIPNSPENSGFVITIPHYKTEKAKPNNYGIQLATIATFDYDNYWRTGQNLQRGEDYKKLKESLASKLIKRAEAFIPDLSNHILDLDIATPITMHRYTLNHQGVAVGWHYTQVKPWKQKVPFINGLFIAGHWTGPSGIPAVIQSGKSAVELILKQEN
jgi:phytoene dehydrogenase-like protein